jgi:diguanylate cyclase (GGDEF)-like protein
MLVIIIFEIKSKNKTQERLYKLSTTDSLTQVFNRGRIIEIFENKLENNNAILLLDIDNFKEINDKFGHVIGDQVLKVIAEILKESVRNGDAVGRYGGEEFLIILDNINEEELHTVSERIRAGLEEHSWSYEGLKTTCSIGVCNIYSDDADEILHHVDQLMYKAKLSGKNQVIYG